MNATASTPAYGAAQKAITIHLSTNLKRLRTLRGYSAEVVANAIDVKRSTLSGWENGASEPDCINLVKLGHYYRFGLDLLLERDLTMMTRFDIEALQRDY